MLFFIVSLIITAFSQPAWVPEFGALAASFGFALFWKAIFDVESRKKRFFLSLVWFACVQGVQLSWMTTMDYMGPMILILYLFLILGMGVQFGLLTLLVASPLNLSRIFAVSGCWVIFEWLRLFFMCGFTWNQVGIALTHSHYSMQFASLFGIFGLSFWVMLVNLTALKALIEKSRKQLIIWIGLAITPYLFGFFHQTWIESNIPILGKLRVVLVQTGLYPEQKDFLSEAPDAYIPPLMQWKRILKTLEGKKTADLIVLPEAALALGAHTAGYNLKDVKTTFDERFFPPLKRPYAIFDFGRWRVCNAFLAQTLANQTGAHIIIGLDDRDFLGKYNAAFHFVPKQASYDRYEKQILVPVGEYVPLRFFHKFSEFLAKQFGIHSSFDAGKESKVFRSHFPIGISICLEETFSSLIRKIRLKGAQLLVNLTNDVWFPSSKLAQQHFDHGKVRAVENGTAILRSCNTGITGAIDCFGRTIATLPPSEEEPRALYLSIPIRSYRTLYIFWGDAGILTISVSALAIYLFLLRRTQKLARPESYIPRVIQKLGNGKETP